RNNYSLNNIFLIIIIRYSRSEEDILDDKNYMIIQKKIMKKSYEMLYVKKNSYINEIKRTFYNLSL
ncbi:hypothetical protein PFNF135_01712, partial [Plasmodium falciparum NF135/5.C10]